MDDGRNGRWTEAGWAMNRWVRTDGIDGCFGKLLGNKGSRFRSGRKTLWVILVISITFQNQRNAYIKKLRVIYVGRSVGSNQER